MSRIRWFSLAALFSLLLASCAPRMNASAPEMDTVQSGEVFSEVAPAMEMEQAVAESASGYEGASASVVNAGDSAHSAMERIIIRTGNISIVMDDPIATTNKIILMAEERGGFVVSSNIYKTQTEQGLEVPEANVTIRVPAETFNQTMEELHNMVKDQDTDITYENTSAQDFTQEYTDLESRKNNLEAAAEQLESFMDRATTTEDVLAVYQQLTQVTEELEIIKGQMQYYEQSDAYSTISVTIIAAEKMEPLTIGGWQPAGIAAKAIQTLINALKIVAEIGIWLVLFLIPLAIVLLAPLVLLFFILRWIVRRRKARKAASTIVPPAPPAEPAQKA